MNTKQCTKCRQTKSLGCFGILKRNKNGYSSWCKECSNEHSKIKYLDRLKTIKYDIIIEKKCTKCQMIKNITEFNKKKSSKNGYRSQCKECKKLGDKIYRNNHKEQAKLYQQQHKEKNRMYGKRSRDKHKEQNKIKDHERYELNKNEVLIKHKKWRSKNFGYQNNYIKNRCQSDSEFCIVFITRNRIKNLLGGNCKSGHTVEIIGIPISEYKQWLQFTTDMNGLKDFDVNNWDHTKFHIDHIVPCSWFNMSDPNQQRECFFFMNTQILRAEDNIRKYNRYYSC